MRIGIAGCGRITERGYVPAVLATPEIEIAGLVDPDQGRLEHCRGLLAAGGAEAPGFSTVGSLLQAIPIDLLIIAVPAQHHFPVAAEAADAGVRSLIEKPPATNLEEARRLAALDPQPLLAFNRRFLQGTELKETIPAEGWLELDLELRFRRDTWGAHEARDEALLDAGIHLIDLACFLTGSAPIAVRRAEVEQERATLELELGRGRARISCATDRGHREEVTISDRSGKALGRATWGGFRARVSGLLGKPDPLVLSLQRQLQVVRALAPELQHHLHPAEVGGAAVRGTPRAASLPTAADGVAAMAVVEAARRSADLSGAEVTVAPAAGVAT